MARRDALMKMTKALVSRRTELRKRLGRDLNDLGDDNTTSTGDAADAAFESTGEELASQLAQLEARELAKVELALQRIKQGRYGVCDGCACKIPVARLNALPYSTLCVKCQQEHESDSAWLGDREALDWDKVRDGDLGEDREVNLADIESDLGK